MRWRPGSIRIVKEPESTNGPTRNNRRSRFELSGRVGKFREREASKRAWRFQRDRAGRGGCHESTRRQLESVDASWRQRFRQTCGFKLAQSGEKAAIVLKIRLLHAGIGVGALKVQNDQPPRMLRNRGGRSLGKSDGEPRPFRYGKIA